MKLVSNSEKRPPAIRLPRMPLRNEPMVHYMPNGIPLYIFPSSNTEVIRLEATFRAGVIAESFPLQARFTNLLLPGGTVKLPAKLIDETFDFLGSFPNYSIDRDRASVQLYLLPSSFKEAADLINEILFSPIFPSDELEMQIEARLQTFLVNRQRVSFVSLDYLFERLFSPDHPYGRRVLPDHFTTTTRERILEFHESNYAGGPERITLSGNIDDSVIKTINDLFGTRERRIPRDDFQSLPPVSHDGTGIFIEMPDALQSSIRLAARTIGMDHPDFPGLRVTDTILGGYFGSRLMSNLREDKGYTYGIGSSLFTTSLTGVQMISTEVGVESTADALREVYHEMDRLASARVPASELRMVKNSMLGELARQFDGPFTTTESYLTALDAGLNMNYFTRLEETIKSITPNEIKRLAGTYYSKENFIEVVAGRMK